MFIGSSQAAGQPRGGPQQAAATRVHLASGFLLPLWAMLAPTGPAPRSPPWGGKVEPPAGRAHSPASCRKPDGRSGALSPEPQTFTVLRLEMKQRPWPGSSGAWGRPQRPGRQPAGPGAPRTFQGPRGSGGLSPGAQPGSGAELSRRRAHSLSSDWSRVSRARCASPPTLGWGGTPGRSPHTQGCEGANLAHAFPIRRVNFMAQKDYG